MGNHNVRRILLAQPPVELPSGALWVLLLMALVAHDDDPKYWAGVNFLVLNMPQLKPGSSRRMVMRHLRTLEDAGYVYRTDMRKGHRTVYQLRMPGSSLPGKGTPWPVDNPPDRWP